MYVPNMFDELVDYSSFFQFPPFSINEVGRFLQAGRREIGHGTIALCKRLLCLVPRK